MADLNYLLRPRSIAIVGVTDKPGTYGLRSATNIVNSAIGEHVYYVNPKRDELLGRKCYHSISEIPEAIDCAVLCVPKKAVCSCMRYRNSYCRNRWNSGNDRKEELTWKRL